MHPPFPARCQGAHVSPFGLSLRVFAPSAMSAWAVIYDEATGPAGRVELLLTHVGGGIWEAMLPGEWSGKFYVFRFAGLGHDELAEVTDPWAVNTVDSGRRARLTRLETTHPPGWERGRLGPSLASPTDAVIYELHVRDFTISSSSGVSRRGGFLGWCESGTTLPGRADIATGLDHLVELGITHVQLMPVHDWDGDETRHGYFWGYMTAAFFSPEGTFASDPLTEARCRELKHLIQALHTRGIGVILDVVLNHFGRDATFDACAPGYYVRHWPDGTRSNGSGCGNDFRSESDQGRRFIIECLKFWVREYGVDGFRFDLMALLDRETLVQAEAELRDLKPDILLYGEPWTADRTAVEVATMDKGGLVGTGYGAFNDDFRHALKGSSDNGEPGFMQKGWHRDGVREGLLGQPTWAPHPTQVIQYLTAHDNLCLYDKLVSSAPDITDAARLRMAQLGYASVLLAQGVPFLHGGDEFFRTKGGDANSYQSPDSVNKIDWRRKAEFAELFGYVKHLIALRRAHPLLRLSTREAVSSRCRFHDHPWWDVIVMEIDGRELPGETWHRALIIFNGSPDTDCQFDTLPEGNWTSVFGSAERNHGQWRVPYQSAVVFAEV